ncbi:unnamed protein product [Malus baccata var. baccata]
MLGAIEGFDRKLVCKQKPRRKIENQEIENEGEENNYFRWNVDMEHVLVVILCEEQRLGNKRRWCLEFFFYAIVSDILSESGFNWDAIKKMISVDENLAWQEYMKSHGGAKRFCWKIIPIVDLCDKDRTMGEGAEIGVEAVEIMTHLHDEPDHIDLVGIDIINQISPTSFVDVPRTKRKSTTPKDMIADSLAKMTSYFKDYIFAVTKKLDPTEVYDEVNAILDLSEEEQIKAYAWLIENDKQFVRLKTLPIEKKKNMVLLLTSRGA